MQLITVTILLLIHGNPTATVFTKLYIYLYEIKRLSNMPKNLIIRGTLELDGMTERRNSN